MHKQAACVEKPVSVAGIPMSVNMGASLITSANLAVFYVVALVVHLHVYIPLFQADLDAGSSSQALGRIPLRGKTESVKALSIMNVFIAFMCVPTLDAIHTVLTWNHALIGQFHYHVLLKVVAPCGFIVAVLIAGGGLFQHILAPPALMLALCAWWQLLNHVHPYLRRPVSQGQSRVENFQKQSVGGEVSWPQALLHTALVSGVYIALLLLLPYSWQLMVPVFAFFGEVIVLHLFSSRRTARYLVLATPFTTGLTAPPWGVTSSLQTFAVPAPAYLLVALMVSGRLVQLAASHWHARKDFDWLSSEYLVSTRSVVSLLLFLLGVDVLTPLKVVQCYQTFFVFAVYTASVILFAFPSARAVLMYEKGQSAAAKLRKVQ